MKRWTRRAVNLCELHNSQAATRFEYPGDLLKGSCVIALCHQIVQDGGHEAEIHRGIGEGQGLTGIGSMGPDLA